MCVCVCVCVCVLFQPTGQKEVDVHRSIIIFCSAAIFGVPKEVCARSYLSAVQKFDKLHGANTCVRHIHFVDVSDDMISVISKTFTYNWDVDLQPPITSGSRRDKGSSRSSAQERQSEPGQQRDTGSSRSSAQERQPEPGQQRGTGSRSSVQERQSEPGQQREKVGTRAEPCAPQYNKTHRNGTGSQPPGSTMRMRYSSKPVAGYEDGGSLCIDYCIPGVQTVSVFFLLLLLLCSPAIFLGFTIFGEIFAYVTISYTNHRGSHIPSLRMVHAGCVFVAGIHPSRT